MSVDVQNQRPGDAPRADGGADRRRRRLDRAEGQSLVELALVLPLLLFFGLACIQFALIFTVYINVINVTRDAARWVAVHPQVLDGDKNTSGTTIYTVFQRLPPGLTASRLTIAISPTCTAISAGKCSTSAARNAGDNITVTSTYDLTDVLFLPATIGWGSWRIGIPQTLPSYSMTLQVEPS